MNDSLQFLLIEDSPVEALVAARALEEAFACSVTHVGSGTEGLKLISSHEFDFAIIDHVLPDIEGIEITRRARAAGVTTPVVVVTGLGSESLIVQALRGGADDHIIKSPDYVTVLPEIVRQVRARRALQKRNDELKSALIEASRLATIGEVTAGIAHEIRNPMTVLLGMAQHLRDNADSLKPDDIRSCADAILRNGRNLTRSLDDALSGVSHTERETLYLCPLIDETLAFMRFNPEFRNHVHTRLEPHGNPTQIIAVGDRNMLRQVFINVLRNAAQSIIAAGRSHGEAIVFAEAVGDKARITIRDNGAGIAPEDIPRLFHSGFSTKRGGGAVSRGAGLGLSICRRIIEEHDGTIEGANREDGPGAIFTIELPLVTADGVGTTTA